MSRVGKQPVILPSGVTAAIDERHIAVSGPKGQLSVPILDGVNVKNSGDKLQLSRISDVREYRAAHGLMRSLIDNMVTGVSQGFEKKLELSGVGYRVSLQGEELEFNLGFSHPVKYKIPSGAQVSVEQNVITVKGIDKQQVGQVAAEIRALKKPEPYKGKGIKYADEQIIRKSGKSGKETA